MDKFLKVQVKRIELEKWYEGVRIQRDPGAAFIMKWIQHYAADYRTSWNDSLCKNCKYWSRCGLNAVSECDFYQSDDSDLS